MGERAQPVTHGFQGGKAKTRATKREKESTGGGKVNSKNAPQHQGEGEKKEDRTKKTGVRLRKGRGGRQKKETGGQWGCLS